MVTKALMDFGVTISSARIATYGERAVDVFYIRDLIGDKITSELKLQKLRETLLLTLDGEDGSESHMKELNLPSSKPHSSAP